MAVYESQKNHRTFRSHFKRISTKEQGKFFIFTREMELFYTSSRKSITSYIISI